MRNYSIVSPAFWTGETGKKIKAAGRDAQTLALYLLTSPHSNMIGMYFLPKLYICYETGLTEQDATKALQSLYEARFCDYDESTEVVWVYQMARFQIGESLTKADNRVKAIQKEFANVPKCRFLPDFFKKYSKPFHLTQAPPKGLKEGLLTEQTSTGTEQDQDFCAEPAAPAPFITLTLNDKTEHPIFDNQIAEWQELYPAVDIRQELRNMRGWCNSNPTKRKTEKGILRFVTSWLAKEQNTGGAHAKTQQVRDTRTPLQRFEDDLAAGKLG